MTGFASSYLSKHKVLKPTIPLPPSEKTGFIIVIPVLCEPGITEVLDSLWACARPKKETEVILVVNAPGNAPAEIHDCNIRTLDLAGEWINKHQDPSLRFFVMNELLPSKDAGVGMARKKGMDEAVCRFNQAGNSSGYIISLDADSRCDPDYLTAIEETITNRPDIRGFDIYFEHPVSGTAFPQNVYNGIIQYELHLRYVNLYLKYTGFPYAHHTVGSCFGVRADIYAAQGGMNKRKGGEDFYFLHKVIPLGNFVDINTTRVVPSPRESFRVPFGTGPAISKYLETEAEVLTYDPGAFRALKQYFRLLPQFYKAGDRESTTLTDPLHASIREFLKINFFLAAIDEINNNSGSAETFCNRFFRWFDAFRIVKYLNFSAREFFPKQAVTKAASQLLRDLGYTTPVDKEALSLLRRFRTIEKASPPMTR